MKPSEKTSFKTLMGWIHTLLKIAGDYRPSFYLIYLSHIIVSSTAPFIYIIFPKYIIDELMGEKNLNKLIIYVTLTVGATFLINVLRNIIKETKGKYADDIGKYTSRVLLEKTLTMDFEQTEDPKVLEQLEKAKTGMEWYSGGICGIADATSNILINAITLTGISGLFLFEMPWIVVLYVGILYLEKRCNTVINQIELAGFKKLSKINRIFGYFFWELQEVRYGKDIRLYGAEETMANKANEQNRAMMKIWREQSLERLPYEQGLNGIGFIRLTLTLILIGARALKGAMTLGDFTMYYNAGNSLHDSLKGIMLSIQDLSKKLNYAKEFIVFVNYPDALVHGQEKVPPCESYTITFRDVSFCYPRGGHKVLKHINMTLHPGEHISVVGLNGAGKTTLIKLLCRLYDPTEGEILLNGVNIKSYDYDEYVKLIAVVFQDFELFAFTARENMTLKDKPDVVDDKEEERLMALVSEAGLSETVSGLEKGLDTYIAKSYEEGGTELSGGQRQKVAIARALYKNAPIVILDEPTAALDPIAEYDIYRQFNTLIGDKTAVYISHRLSSCQFCDIIYVFEEGRITEVGTHEALVGQEEGSYAKMFEAQAQYYR